MVQRRPTLWIIAGPNGAGKSTLARASLCPGSILDPDAICRRIRRRIPWIRHVMPRWLYDDGTNYLGVWFVEACVRMAIWRRRSVAFETVLSTMKYLPHVRRARRRGFEIHMLFIALPDPEEHVRRVSLRVRAGGHHVPAQKIRDRWHRSHENLLEFMPHLDCLVVVRNWHDPWIASGAHRSACDLVRALRRAAMGL